MEQAAIDHVTIDSFELKLRSEIHPRASRTIETITYFEVSISMDKSNQHFDYLFHSHRKKCAEINEYTAVLSNKTASKDNHIHQISAS